MVYIVITVISSWWMILLSLYNVCLCLLLLFLAWSLFCWWVWLHPLAFGCHLFVHLPSYLFEPLFVFNAEMSLLGAAYSWVFFLSSYSVFWLVHSIHLHLGWLLINEDLFLSSIFCFLVALYWLFFSKFPPFCFCLPF